MKFSQPSLRTRNRTFILGIEVAIRLSFFSLLSPIFSLILCAAYVKCSKKFSKTSSFLQQRRKAKFSPTQRESTRRWPDVHIRIFSLFSIEFIKIFFCRPLATTRPGSSEWVSILPTDQVNSISIWLTSFKFLLCFSLFHLKIDNSKSCWASFLFFGFTHDVFLEVESVYFWKFSINFHLNMLNDSWLKRQFKLTIMFKKSKFYFFKIDPKMDLDNL